MLQPPSLQLSAQDRSARFLDTHFLPPRSHSPLQGTLFLALGHRLSVSAHVGRLSTHEQARNGRQAFHEQLTFLGIKAQACTKAQVRTMVQVRTVVQVSKEAQGGIKVQDGILF